MTDDSDRGPGWLPTRLARIQKLAEEHGSQTKLTAQRDCPHDQGTAVFAYRFRNGDSHTADGCVQCHKPMGQWLKIQPDPEIPVGRDDRFENPPCVRCGDFGTELHHFAPTAIFGKPEADLWPTAWLCRGCHNYWHRMMAGEAVA